VVVGARVVWKGYKGVVVDEVSPGMFTIRFDHGFYESARADELRVL
jgi:hypothetical protein